MTTTIETPAVAGVETAPAVNQSISDMLVGQAAILFPEIEAISNPGLAKMTAMLLLAASGTGTDVTFDQAYASAMEMYSGAADSAKTLAAEKERLTKKSLNDFRLAVTDTIVENASKIDAAYRPTAGYRILVSFDAHDVNHETGETLKGTDGSLVNVPVLVTIEPVSVKRVGSSNSGNSGGSSGRTIGVFRLVGTTDNIQLSAFATSQGKPSDNNEPARDWLEKNGWTIDQTATDVSGVMVKYIRSASMPEASTETPATNEAAPAAA